MLNNTLTLDVNDDNDDGTTPAVELTFNRWTTFENRSIFIGENHTLESRQMLGFYRTPQKINGNFRGAAKCSLKVTKDLAIAGVDSSTTLTVPRISEVSFSLPVGMTEAERKTARMELVAILSDDDIMDPLLNSLSI